MLKEADSELNFSITQNGRYNFYMNKDGKVNSLRITTKENDANLNRSMRELEKRLSETFGLVIKREDQSENFDEDEFVVTCFDNCSLDIFFKEFDISKIIDIIRYSRSIEKELSTFESREPDYDYYDDVDDDWEL